MPPSEWVELEQLSRDIADAQGRLRTADAAARPDLSRDLATMDMRRSELFSRIGSTALAEPEAAAEEANIGETLPQSLAVVEPGTSSDTDRSRKPRGDMVWKQLTRADLDHAKQDVERQRSEMLARHAEELKSIEAEAAEVSALEQAIEAFLQKFGGPAVENNVVPLASGGSSGA